MKNFKYIAITADGKKLRSNINATNAQQAKKTLKEQGLIVLSIVENNQPLNRFSKQPSNQDICLFTRQLATFLAAGISLSDALSGMEQEQSQVMRPFIQGIYQKVVEGYSLAQALQQYPKLFSKLYCATIYAGEQSGQLDNVLEQLANYIEQQHHAKQKIQQALIYPCLMISVSVMIIVFLMTEVVPKILAIFDDNQQSLPVITKILIVLSRGISLLLPYILIAALILIVYFLRKKTDLKFKRAWHKALIENSLYKRFIQLTQIPRYLHTMHILLSSGVNVLDSMNVSTQLLTNLIVQDAFNRATQQVKEGIAISRSLAQTHWFSNMTIHLIQSGEKSGQLAVMLERSAMQIDTTRQQFLDTALKLLEPLIILLMGGFVLFIVLAILLPIFQMQQLV